MPDLTPSERAHLRDMATWRAEGDFEREFGALVLRLLDEADRLREDWQKREEWWALALVTSERWRRTLLRKLNVATAESKRLRRQRDNARRLSDLLENRARRAEIAHDERHEERDTARRWARAWKAAAKTGMGIPLATYKRMLDDARTARAEADALRARVAELEGEVRREQEAGVTMREEARIRARQAEQDRDTLRAFAASALDLLHRADGRDIGDTCIGCGRWGECAPDCALAALLREGEGLALDAPPARDSSSAQ